MMSIGADVHKRTTTFHALDEDGESIKEFNKLFRAVPSNKESFEKMKEYLHDSEYRILMENSTKTHDVYWIMEGLGMDVTVAHSTDLARITRSDKKNDDNDAKELAMYMMARLQGVDQFRECYMCPEVWMKKKEIMQDSQAGDDERRRPETEDTVGVVVVVVVVRCRHRRDGRIREHRKSVEEDGILERPCS